MLAYLQELLRGDADFTVDLHYHNNCADKQLGLVAVDSVGLVLQFDHGLGGGNRLIPWRQVKYLTVELGG